MNSLRRWLYRPKRSDQSLLAQFYFADEELNHVAAELDSFEGRGEPERCAALVNQLRACQARVLNVVSQMMDESIKDQRALRDFRVKFPDDLCQENLAGQLWFGAECLAAGSSIMNKEVESACMRPLARALTKNLDSLRTILREQCLQNVNEYTELITESLIIFDKLFAEFELSYVSAMAPVKTAHEYDMIQEITVLFSETVHRALKVGLLSQDMIDEYDPALMFTIPRLAIICGTVIFKDGPLNPDNEPRNISEMFRPFQTLLHKIRELLSILTFEELNTLERALCSQDEPSFLVSLEENRKQAREERRRQKGKKSVGKAKKRIDTQEEDDGSIESELTAREIAERLEALALNFEASRNNSEPGAHGGCDSERPAESQYENDEVSSSSSSSSSSSPLSCSVVDGACQRHQAAPLDNTDHEDIQKSNAFKDADSGHKNECHNETSAFLENAKSRSNNSADILPNSEKIETDDHASLISDVKYGNTSELNDKGTDDDDEDDRNVEKNSGAYSNETGRYELNKCDSNDSGLHSEIMSNSGSMFTISSSDSNQQITNSESACHIPDQIETECLDESLTESIQPCRNQNAPSTNCQDNDPEDVSPRSSECDAVNHLKYDGSEIKANQTLPLDCASCLPEKEKEIDLDQSRLPLSTHANMTAQYNSDANAASLPGCSEKSGSAAIAMPFDEIDNVLNADDTNSCRTVSNVDNFQEESSVQSQQEAELDNKHNLRISHACALIASSENSCESKHSLDNFSNNACDITVNEINQSRKCAKMCKDEGNSLLTEAENTYSKNSTDVANSETDPSYDTQSLTVEPKLQLEGTIQEHISAASTLHTASTDDFIQNNDKFPHSSAETSSVTTILNGYSDSLSPTQAENLRTSALNSSTNAKISESTDVALAHSSNNSAHSLPSQTRTKPCSKRSHHRGQKESRRANRSSMQSRLSRDPKPKLCAAHAKMMLQASQLDSDCYNSSETSSYTSDCGDQEEIALAIEAAENASRNNVRARFKSNSDMIHRLFVCISGVADQLQTNFAGDLRNILRSVFDMNCSEPVDKSDSDKPKDSTPLVAAYRAMSHAARASRHRHSSLRRQEPPNWLPDEQCNECMACQVPFSFVRRRHHCRNCGKIFCGRCSSNYVPLPQFGQEKAVRVCNRCFMFQVTPFH